MFAPAHHGAMKHVVPVRKELAVRTIFNFLGPLTNPAGATRQLLGVSDRRYQETIAEALAGLGCDHALVVSAEDGLDELSISGVSRVIEVRDGHTEEWHLGADEVGLAEAPLESLAGGEPAENAAVAGRSSPARPGRSGTLPCSTPARRSTSPARPRTSARASSAPPGDRLRCRRPNARAARRAERRACGLTIRSRSGERDR